MIYILYHANCFDGFGAAWIATKALEAQDKLKWGIPRTIQLVPCTYGDPIPEIKDSHVYILDFSFPREVMLKFKAENASVVCLDHHKTAQADLEGLDFCTFDMNRSGAGLTWDYFYPGVPRPDLINFIEDRDLWRFTLPKTRAIFEYVASFPKELEVWDRLNNDIIYHYADCVFAGEAILRYHDQKVEELSRSTSMQEIDGYRVPVVNCPYMFASDVLHLLLQQYPDAPFAAGWSETRGMIKRYSLRGRDTDDFDVSKVAERFGGGGHKKAAGFEIKLVPVSISIERD